MEITRVKPCLIQNPAPMQIPCVSVESPWKVDAHSGDSPWMVGFMSLWYQWDLHLELMVRQEEEE